MYTLVAPLTEMNSLTIVENAIAHQLIRIRVAISELSAWQLLNRALRESNSHIPFLKQRSDNG
jgi:hypothetical protein